MGSELFYETAGLPPRGARLQELVSFLGKAGLKFDAHVEYTVTLTDAQGAVIATGSMDHNVLKCIAVDGNWRGEGLSAAVVTRLLGRAGERGLRHLFLYTKPENAQMFSELSFYPVIETRDVALMENERDGIRRFAASLEKGASGHVGAIVMNCNPFTKGHAWLVSQAAARCDTLHLFVVSDDRSLFPADVRFELVRAATRDMDNVYVHPTNGYLVSSATFPTYFLKENQDAGEVSCQLDLSLFCTYFVPELGITERFAGSEPFCPVTNRYNDCMREYLPAHGVAFTELARHERGDMAVSASEVRRRLLAGDLDGALDLVPETTAQYLRSPEGRALIGKHREAEAAR